MTWFSARNSAAVGMGLFACSACRLAPNLAPDDSQDIDLQKKKSAKGGLEPPRVLPDRILNQAERVTSHHLRLPRVRISGFIPDFRSELTSHDLTRGSSGGSSFKEDRTPAVRAAGVPGDSLRQLELDSAGFADSLRGVEDLE